MPKGADGVTKGLAFVEFHNPAEAAAAIEQTNGYKLDKAHVFKVSKFDDFSKYDAVPDAYKAPEPKPYVARENTASYMLDDRGRDQFAIRFGDETEVHWNDAQVKEPVEVYKRSFWTESYVQWSPRGELSRRCTGGCRDLWGAEPGAPSASPSFRTTAFSSSSFRRASGTSPPGARTIRRTRASRRRLS